MEPCVLSSSSFGSTATVEEALENIREAIQACVEGDDDATDTVFLGVRDVEMAIWMGSIPAISFLRASPAS